MTAIVFGEFLFLYYLHTILSLGKKRHTNWTRVNGEET